MRQRAYNMLGVIQRSALLRWSVVGYSDRRDKQADRYNAVSMGELLTRNRQRVVIEENKFYCRLTVRVHNAGIVQRDLVMGSKIGTKHQFIAHGGQFLVSKIDARNGAMGIIPKKLNGAVVTADFLTYEVDSTRIMPEYLELACASETFLEKCRDASSGTTNRQRVSEDRFLAIKMPLPPLDIQRILVRTHEAKLRKSVHLERQVSSSKSDVEFRIMAMLGIKQTTNDNNKRCRARLREARFKDVMLWSLWVQSSEYAEIFGDSSYPIVSLGDVYEFVTRNWKRTESKFRYVELQAIDPLLGITSAQELMTSKAPVRATQTVCANDLMIGLTRPYLKKFAIVPKAYAGCVCSSGFQIIGPSDRYDLKFLYYYLMTPSAVRQLKHYMTGALYPSLTVRNLRKVLIPLPPLQVQQKIVETIESEWVQMQSKQRCSDKLRQDARKEFAKEVFGS